MYAAYFGLKQDPFSIAPDPHFLFLSERHREALAHLLFGVRGGGGFVLLTGDIGTGKTTVCRRFLEEAPEHAVLAYIFNPRLSVIELLRTVCDEFHVEVRHSGAGDATVKDHLDPLNDFLLQQHAAGRHAVLIIDEAQNLDADVLEQLRLLTNLETHQRKLLQIVLIGQPELRGQLARPELEQLAQRVIARFHLGPLEPMETRLYIEHRLSMAGRSAALPFTGHAIKRIHVLSGGVPRRINLLCGRALLGAYAKGRTSVDLQVVEQAAREVFDSPRPGSRPARWRAVTWALAGGLAGVALSAGIAWNRGLWRPAAPPVAAFPSAPRAAPVPLVAPAVALAVPIAPPVPPAVAALEFLPGEPAAADLLPSENAGWSSLARHWGETLPDGEPCAAALGLGLQCFRTPRLTLEGLKRLDRPALLRLRLDDGTGGWLMLSALDAETARFSQGDRHWRLPLVRLKQWWFGGYATLWRTPPGHVQRVNHPPSPDAARWLDAQLTALQSEGRLDAAADTAAARLRAFQTGQGIAPDPQPTATTFMQTNRARDVAEPRLSAPQP
jgi:general secretion pathway protein A